MLNLLILAFRFWKPCADIIAKTPKARGCKGPPKPLAIPTRSRWVRLRLKSYIWARRIVQGDIVVWLPKQNLVIAGDMAFHERMLPIFPHTNAADWIETWDTAFEPLGATHIIPGHGHPTVMPQVRRYTRDYLAFLRRKIGDLIEEGGELEQAYYIDQSPYAHLDTFEELARRNAGFVYEQMEFE